MGCFFFFLSCSMWYLLAVAGGHRSLARFRQHVVLATGPPGKSQSVSVILINLDLSYYLQEILSLISRPLFTPIFLYFIVLYSKELFFFLTLGINFNKTIKMIINAISVHTT